MDLNRLGGRKVGTNMGLNVYYKVLALGCASRPAGRPQFKYVAMQGYIMSCLIKRIMNLY